MCSHTLVNKLANCALHATCEIEYVMRRVTSENFSRILLLYHSFKLGSVLLFYVLKQSGEIFPWVSHTNDRWCNGRKSYLNTG